MNIIKTVLIVIGITALLVGGFCAFQAFTGRVDVSASAEHGALTTRLLQGTRQASVSRAARDVDTQLANLNDQDILFEAVVGYQDMCAACHTPPGGSATAMSRGLNPPATDLAWAGANRSPAELFQVTKHGIRMTGMPAWGPTHNDAELWPIVALITRFPDFADDDYGNLLEAALEAGVEHHHHHDDHDHGHEHHQDHDDSHQHHHDHNEESIEHD